MCIVTHAMDDNTRAKLGHSLDGELRRDSSDFLGAILIPTSQATGAADVSAPLTWTSDDSNMQHANTHATRDPATQQRQDTDTVQLTSQPAWPHRAGATRSPRISESPHHRPFWTTL